MTIEDTCRCGATLRVNERNHVAAAYRHEAWLKAHAVCQSDSASIDLAETLRRVVANEGNHYDRYWTPPPEPVTDEWLADTEAKMRDALTDAFCDDAAAIMLTLVGEIRRSRNAA